MEMREEIMAVKHELEEVKNESFAYEMLKDQRKQNKRMFIIIMVLLPMVFVLTGCLFYIMSDINTTTTEEVIEVEQDSGDNGNNNFITGDSNEVNN